MSAVQQIKVDTYILFHYALWQDTEYKSLCHTAGPECLSILGLNRFHLLIPNSQSFPPPWQPQACSLCLWVCSCFFDTFLLDSTYEWCHRIIVFLSLSTSLNMLISRSIHAAAKGIISFLKCLSSIPVCVCIGTYNIFFIHSSVDEHLGCFHVLDIVSCAAINIGVHECSQGIVFFQIYAQDRNCWIIWKLCVWVFEELPCCFPQWLNQFPLPQQSQRVSLFSTPSPASIIRQLFNDGHSDLYEVVPHCSVDLPFSTN